MQHSKAIDRNACCMRPLVCCVCCLEEVRLATSKVGKDAATKTNKRAHCNPSEKMHLSPGFFHNRLGKGGVGGCRVMALRAQKTTTGQKRKTICDGIHAPHRWCPPLWMATAKCSPPKGTEAQDAQGSKQIKKQVRNIEGNTDQKKIKALKEQDLQGSEQSQVKTGEKHWKETTTRNKTEDRGQEKRTKHKKGEALWTEPQGQTRAGQRRNERRIKKGKEQKTLTKKNWKKIYLAPRTNPGFP